MTKEQKQQIEEFRKKLTSLTNQFTEKVYINLDLDDRKQVIGIIDDLDNVTRDLIKLNYIK
jgi:hypothetical protein